MSLEHPVNPYEFTRGIESPGQDKRLKITRNEEEFMVPDPSLYVTRVIAPEEEVQRRIRAKQLAEALRLQMQQKKDRDAKAKRDRILQDLEEEKRYNAQAPPSPKKTGLARVNPNAMSQPNLPVASAVKEVEEKCERKYGDGYEESCERKEYLAVSDAPLAAEYKIPYYDNELEKLRRELHEKDMEFSNTLNKLRDNFFSISSSKSNVERELNAVKKYIQQRPEPYSYFDTLKSASHFRLPASYKKSEQGMGRYSQLYLTSYKPQLSKNQFKSTAKPLLGESSLVPWKETSEFIRPETNRSSALKEKHNTLDDLIDGFLSDVHPDKSETLSEIVKEKVKKEVKEEKVKSKEVQTSTEELRNEKPIVKTFESRELEGEHFEMKSLRIKLSSNDDKDEDKADENIVDEDKVGEGEINEGEVDEIDVDEDDADKHDFNENKADEGREEEKSGRSAEKAEDSSEISEDWKDLLSSGIEQALNKIESPQSTSFMS
eukprot:TRINITY_DN2500_c0_g4_i1.p1 TRINITY_DN2500_c0_g4~~TRINITY_DN2500_c0_g4_i1.p1  ORF type:complete len:490 (-),score=122.53 TRINITY_DN2500_c0_g4_i1:152-1621(-)